MDAVEAFWIKARFKTLQRKNSIKLLANLDKCYRKLLRHSKKDTPKEVQKRKLFEEDIDKLFDIGK